MRILVIAMSDSIHTARWLSQFDHQEHQIVLFPSTSSPPHAHLKSWGKFYSLFQLFFRKKRGICTIVPLLRNTHLLNAFLNNYVNKNWRKFWLKQTISVFRPDVIHTLEFQHAGYLCLNVRSQWKGKFPTWIATNWGSDIFLFARLQDHQSSIRAILETADYYSAECHRDYELAKELGMTAKPLPVIPNAGGLQLEKMVKLRSRVAPKDRKLIIVKGYQSIFGRALVALQALSKIHQHLKDYEIQVYSATPDVMIASELAKQDYGLNIKFCSNHIALEHDKILELQASARVYIGLSISDGISTSLLEAMALGTFPIQTCTSCAKEWITHGQSGFIVDHDDPEKLSQYILETLNNDDLVTQAAEANWKTIQARASYEHIAQVAKSFYEVAGLQEKSAKYPLNSLTAK